MGTDLNTSTTDEICYRPFERTETYKKKHSREICHSRLCLGLRFCHSHFCSDATDQEKKASSGPSSPREKQKAEPPPHQPATGERSPCLINNWSGTQSLQPVAKWFFKGLCAPVRRVEMRTSEVRRDGEGKPRWLTAVAATLSALLSSITPRWHRTELHCLSHSDIARIRRLSRRQAVFASYL